MQVNKRMWGSLTRGSLLAAVVLLTATASSAQITGSIEKVWIEYGVKVKGEAGIYVHTRFSVSNALKIGCSIQAIIEREDGGIMLTKSIGSVYTVDKNVLVLKTFTPPYDAANYPDTKLFIPHWALALKASDPNKMKVTVAISGQNKEFAKSTLNFTLPLGAVN